MERVVATKSMASLTKLTSLFKSAICFFSLGILYTVFDLIEYVCYCSYVVFEHSFKSLSFDSITM